MSDLHKFKDDCKTPEDRAKPIKAQDLDDNFRIVRLRVVGPTEEFFKIKEKAKQNDELHFAFDVPASGTYVMGFVNGVFSLIEAEDC